MDVLRFLNHILPFDECAHAGDLAGEMSSELQYCCSQCSHWTTRVFEIALAF